jgi:hypothetical protein
MRVKTLQQRTQYDTMNEDNFSPLDPNEGPTIWAKQSKSNSHTIKIVIGTNPNDPFKSFELSHNEIKRLNKLIGVRKE